MQSSSLGSLGYNQDDWLFKDFLKALALHRNGNSEFELSPALNVIYPSRKNVINCYYGEEGAGCLPYSEVVHAKQKWLEKYLQ